jgi:hypothetical protein
MSFAGVLALISGAAMAQNAPSRENLVEPAFDPSNFGQPITNKYLTLKPGAKFVFEKKTDAGTKRTEVEVTNDTKEVMGVTATVVRDREWINGELHEDTRDWYAQDKAGNVWYFGEFVENYEGGKPTNHDGSWEAGIDGGKPGIAMLKEPKVGDTYRQEYLPGKAEDMGTVAAVGVKVSVAQGKYDDCVQIRDWSRIKESPIEYKYYCAGVGFMVKEEKGTEAEELVSASVK